MTMLRLFSPSIVTLMLLLPGCATPPQTPAVAATASTPKPAESDTVANFKKDGGTVLRRIEDVAMAHQGKCRQQLDALLDEEKKLAPQIAKLREQAQALRAENKLPNPFDGKHGLDDDAAAEKKKAALARREKAFEGCGKIGTLFGLFAVMHPVFSKEVEAHPKLGALFSVEGGPAPQRLVSGVAGLYRRAADIAADNRADCSKQAVELVKEFSVANAPNWGPDAVDGKSAPEIKRLAAMVQTAREGQLQKRVMTSKAVSLNRELWLLTAKACKAERSPSVYFLGPIFKPAKPAPAPAAATK